MVSAAAGIAPLSAGVNDAASTPGYNAVVFRMDKARSQPALTPCLSILMKRPPELLTDAVSFAGWQESVSNRTLCRFLALNELLVPTFWTCAALMGHHIFAQDGCCGISRRV